MFSLKLQARSDPSVLYGAALLVASLFSLALALFSPLALLLACVILVVAILRFRSQNSKVTKVLLWVAIAVSALTISALGAMGLAIMAISTS